ncbi:D-alanyl-D-alanine carboxypeptidase (penicillin-binding protein 5/6) [Granulicatella balaenopterae]|uniref:D-alanyl-D-alanine carboxypeptidase (Penicillin-binding protein 5/6) n=1 Tax=Granulicatella balaenopterae TaxID=137733 RepID=A0A1H9LQX4_9LACT|nr:serine hydrolase [Granulicatella balaenopterae]SER13816.1 D-alanyl-D-alanine carboxypeptidase (penicillin-binding protein 5/6) [Granulicatella balaenopterae]
MTTRTKKNRHKKKYSLTILLLVFVVLVGFWRLKPYFWPQHRMDSSKYHAESIYVYNLTDHKEVKSLNENQKRKPASLVKIMTVYTALQNSKDLSKAAPVDTESYQALVAQNASMAGFYGNESTTYRDLLYGAMLPSGGECADSLAINIAGSREGFVDLMNQQAEKMNLGNTHYENPDGLDSPNQYTTAKDIALILEQALQDGDFYAIFTKKAYLSTATNNHPQGVWMQSTVFTGLEEFEQQGFEILGGKTGTTDKAGLCLATLAQKDGKEYIVVVMGVPYLSLKNPGKGQFKDTIKIMEEL